MAGPFDGHYAHGSDRPTDHFAECDPHVAHGMHPRASWLETHVCAISPCPDVRDCVACSASLCSPTAFAQLGCTAISKGAFRRGMNSLPMQSLIAEPRHLLALTHRAS